MTRSLIVGLCLLAAGCGKHGGRITLATTAAPRTFNPLFALDGSSDAVARLLNSGLVTTDMTNHEAKPGLAESWSVAPDQKTWTFKLRQGLLWSDGHPLTAADVVFTWNDVMYNSNYNRLTYNLFRIGDKPFEVTQVDERTVRVVTPEVFAPFLEFFGGVAVLPKHALEAAVKADLFPNAYAINTPPERIVGCGPFCVKDYEAAQWTLLQPNPHYWAPDDHGGHLPYFKEVKIIATGRPEAEADAFLQGKCDAYENVRPENFARFKQAAAAGKFSLYEPGMSGERDFIWFNQNTGADAQGKPFVDPVKLKWFRNQIFRQAVSCAVDRERIAREVYGGRAQPIYGFISEENPKWNNPNVPRFAYDPARARSLLAQIGIQDRKGSGVAEDADGRPIEMAFLYNTGNPMREKAAALIQDDLKKIGIRFNATPIDFRLLIEKVNGTFDYECALMGLGGGGVDPAAQLNVLRSTEELHQWFPNQRTPSTEWEARVDSLMDAQMRTLDYGQRKKMFDEVQVILAEQQPMIYTVAPLQAGAIRSDIGNVRPSGLTPYHVTWNLEELYFKKR